MLKRTDIYRISRLCPLSAEFYKPAVPRYFGTVGFAV